MASRFLRALLVACGLSLAVVAPTSAQNARPVAVHNECGIPVRIMVYHAERYRVWQVRAWWTVNARQNITLNTDGRTLTHLDDHNLFFYAEALDNRRNWAGSDTSVQYRGTTYNLRRAQTSVVGGNLVLRLTC